MSSHNNPLPGDFDARLQFLLQSSESLHANLQELHATVAEHTEQLKASDGRTERLLSATENLLAIVKSHHDRLDKLDGGK